MDKKLDSLKIGFLGAGAMATALAKGFIGAGLVTPSQVKAYDVNSASASKFAAATGASSAGTVQELLNHSQVLFLAVKPFHVAQALHSIAGMSGEQLLISIAAGVSTEKLETLLPAGSRVVRVMPNTPMLVSCGASGFCLGKAATEQDRELVSRFLSAVGVAYQVSETQMDAVTGLSGSGPAFIYMMIEALSDGGVASGLPRDISTRLAAQTVMGSAKMVLETGLHPGALKDMVTSPAGTTIEGVQKLEEGGVRAAFIRAVRAATERSREQGKK